MHFSQLKIHLTREITSIIFFLNYIAPGKRPFSSTWQIFYFILNACRGTITHIFINICMACCWSVVMHTWHFHPCGKAPGICWGILFTCSSSGTNNNWKIAVAWWRVGGVGESFRQGGKVARKRGERGERDESACHREWQWFNEFCKHRTFSVANRARKWSSLADAVREIPTVERAQICVCVSVCIGGWVTGPRARSETRLSS